VALQQTTRELWAQQGPFEPYTIHGVPQQNIPEIYIKGAVWNAQADPPRYVAQSSAPEESGTGTWFPVDFNEEHVCWVEVRLQEPAGSEAYWQAFRIAGQDLGLDITQGDVEAHLQTTTLNSYRESVASSHSSRASTPSVPSIIRPRPSPYQPGSRVLRFAKRCPTWTRIVWMQPFMTQLWSSDTRYRNTRSNLYVRRRRSTSTNIDKR
jgi:hypothetical protein